MEPRKCYRLEILLSDDSIKNEIFFRTVTGSVTPVCYDRPRTFSIQYVLMHIES